MTTIDIELPIIELAYLWVVIDVMIIFMTIRLIKFIMGIFR